MTFKRCIAFSTVALAFAAPAAYAQNWIYFDSADTNHDGVVSRSEWDQAARQHSRTGTPTFAPPASAGSSASAASAPNELVIVTITPLQARMMNEQRRESLFRSLDANGDGTVSAAEAGVNTELVNAFARLDQNHDGKIDRQEFARVHVNDGSQQQGQAAGASAAQGASSGKDEAGLVQRPPLPSRSIEERSKFSVPADQR